jgi:hypothetical protein
MVTRNIEQVRRGGRRANERAEQMVRLSVELRRRLRPCAAYRDIDIPDVVEDAVSSTSMTLIPNGGTMGSRPFLAPSRACDD